MSTNKELWLPIKGYEGLYEVSNTGYVRSIRRNNKLLKYNSTSYGYKRVGLYKDGKQKFHTIHRLVAETFIPNDNLLPEVNHIDGDKFNNTVENLEWCTQSYNIQHAYNMGLTTNFGEKHKDNKLTRLDVIWIREHYKKNSREFGSGAIARKFNVSDTLVRDIIHHKKWKHV